MHSIATISILAVDDEPYVLEVIGRHLSREGRVTVTTASSGAEALERLEKGPAPDLVITDLRMPAMQGDELVSRIRLTEPDMKVLYLTSHADGLFEAKPLLWENEAFLEKPFTREGLREAVALLLDGHTQLEGFTS
jgi:CheY-like chemotaxis protein